MDSPYSIVLLGDNYVVFSLEEENGINVIAENSAMLPKQKEKKRSMLSQNPLTILHTHLH